MTAPGAVKWPWGSANNLRFLDVATMYSRMWPASLKNAVWICSPDCLFQLMELAVTPLTGQALDYPGGGSGDGVTYRLLGRPLIVSEKMPSSSSGTTITPGALTFVDLNYYLIGDRMTMQVASSDQYLFANDLMAYRIIERLDGRFWLQSAITPENGSTNTLSPLVIGDSTS